MGTTQSYLAVCGMGNMTLLSLTGSAVIKTAYDSRLFVYIGNIIGAYNLDYLVYLLMQNIVDYNSETNFNLFLDFMFSGSIPGTVSATDRLYDSVKTKDNPKSD